MGEFETKSKHVLKSGETKMKFFGCHQQNVTFAKHGTFLQTELIIMTPFQSKNHIKFELILLGNVYRVM